MKRLLATTIALSLLSACGTEVGNGFKPKDKKEESNRDTFEETIGSGGGVPTSESAGVDWTTFLFAPCASPFSAPVAARYVSGTVSLETQVTGNDVVVTLKNAPLPTSPTRTGTIARAVDTISDVDIRHVDASALMANPAAATCGGLRASEGQGTFTVRTYDLDITYLGFTANVSWRLESTSPDVRAMTVTFTDGSTYTFTPE